MKKLSFFHTPFHETGHQVRRQAGKIIERKKEKASVSSAGEETVYQPKEQIRPVPPSGGEKAQEQGKKLAVKKIKTVERDKRTIKTGKASEQVVKNTGKGTIKTSGKSVKTAEQTAKTSIKTSEAHHLRFSRTSSQSKESSDVEKRRYSSEWSYTHSCK